MARKTDDTITDFWLSREDLDWLIVQAENYLADRVVTDDVEADDVEAVTALLFSLPVDVLGRIFGADPEVFSVYLPAFTS